MSEKIEFEVTESILSAAAKAYWEDCNSPDTQYEDSGDAQTWHLKAALTAALSHPSFRKQLRAYVAGEMRKVVPENAVNVVGPQFCAGYNTGRLATLANIAAYEKEQEDD